MACRAAFRASRKCLSGNIKPARFRSCQQSGQQPALKDSLSSMIPNQQSSFVRRAGRCTLGCRRWGSQATSQTRSMSTHTCEDVNIDDVIDGVLHHTKLYIDVRDPSELTETGSIGHSLNIPIKQLDEALSMSNTEFENVYHHVKPQQSDDNIIVFCRSGFRAGCACEILQKHGYNFAKKFPGSMNEWEETLLGSTAARRHHAD